MSDSDVTTGGDDAAGPDIRSPKLYQVGLDLRGRACLVVGGGAVARRKVDGLMEAGGAVTVVAPECGAMPPGVAVERRPFRGDDLSGIELAVAATGDRELNARIAQLARSLGIWVNAVDDPAASSVILPATLQRGALQIAISTGGASPALARRLRQRLEGEFASEYADLTALLGDLRRAWSPQAIAAGVPPAARQQAWEQVLDLPLLELLRAGRGDEARSRARSVLETVLGDNAR